MKEGESINACLTSLFADARRRRTKECDASILSLVMKHLVGAMLSMLRDKKRALVDDFQSDRFAMPSGDFRVQDMVIYVTSIPEWPLLHRCFEDFDRGLRPLVISTRAGVALVESLADEVGMRCRLEVLDITQFLVANMLEWTGFEDNQRRTTFEELVARYNKIVEDCETDPSLKIDVA